jgi:hypothetical protein
VVTPATVGSRSGSASVKGTVRKQNEDRFASYVRPPPVFRETPMGLRARGRRDAAASRDHHRSYHTPSPTIRDSSRLFSSDARETSSFPCADTNATNVFDTR